MIITKSVTILCLIVLAEAGTIKQRNIPVEIRYDEHSSEGNSVKNLDEKVQLPAEQLKELVVEEIVEQKPEEDNSNSVEKGVNAIRNLDEKVQLSQEELSQAIKHIPAQSEILNDNIAEEDITSVKKLQVDGEQVTQEPTKPLNIPGILNEAQEIIVNSLKKLKVSFKPDTDQKAPNPTQWLDFEKSVNEFLESEKSKIQIKQDQPDQTQNFFQNIANGFQTIANNFIQGFNNGQNTTNQGDEQVGTQGPFQGFVSYFQGGVNNIVNSITNLGNQGPTTTNTVLGDPGTATTQAPGFIQGFVNNVQQFLGNIQSGTNQGATSGSQSDTGVNATASNQPQGPVQVIQSIGTAVSQFFQGGNRPPNTSGDEGTTPSSTNVIQSIGQNIGNAIQNSPFNPFRPQAGQDGATSQNPIQAGVQNVGNQIQQLIPGNLTQKNPEVVPPKEQNTINAEKAPEPVEAAEPVEAVEAVEAAEQQEETVNEEIVQEEENKEVAEENKVSEDKKDEILMASE